MILLRTLGGIRRDDRSPNLCEDLLIERLKKTLSGIIYPYILFGTVLAKKNRFSGIER